MEINKGENYMQKRLAVIIVFDIILTMIFSGCNSKQNSKSTQFEDWTKFSAYSSNKELKVYGEISSTDFKKGKEFTVTAHVKI